MSITRVLMPISPSAMAVGTPTDPAPTMITSLFFKVIASVCPGQYPDRDFDKQGPVDAIRYPVRINTLFFKNPPDHRPAGL
jgi:hypothetical protein